MFGCRCGCSGRLQAENLKKGRFSLKKGKNGHFDGFPEKGQKWPFLTLFLIYARASAFYFAIFSKKFVFDKRVFGGFPESPKIPLFDPKTSILTLKTGVFDPPERPSKPRFLRGLFGLQPARTPTPTPEHYLRARLGPVDKHK